MEEACIGPAPAARELSEPIQSKLAGSVRQRKKLKLHRYLLPTGNLR
jgi:hypothetical protein